MDLEISCRNECRVRAAVAHADDSQIAEKNVRSSRSGLRMDLASVCAATSRKSGDCHPQRIAPFVLASRVSPFEPATFGRFLVDTKPLLWRIAKALHPRKRVRIHVSPETGWLDHSRLQHCDGEKTVPVLAFGTSLSQQ